MGNLGSVQNMLKRIGAPCKISSDPKEIEGAEKILLPGVGAFGKGMENLEKYNLIEILNEYVDSGKPLLGVCLGMQMLLEDSDEFQITKGLGFIKGRVKKMEINPNSKDKIPHVSWNELIIPHEKRWDNTILKNIAPNSDNILAQCEYGGNKFCAAINNKNIYGTQFHPEKSAKIGQRILNNFISII